MVLGAFQTVPVLVVCGDEDLLTPLEHSEEICRALPHAQLVVIPEAGHVVLLEHPEAVNAVLVPFIRKLVP
jgi:pimeloyl-ACP methyl ester carboxylesterase